MARNQLKALRNAISANDSIVPSLRQCNYIRKGKIVPIDRTADVTAGSSFKIRLTIPLFCKTAVREHGNRTLLLHQLSYWQPIFGRISLSLSNLYVYLTHIRPVTKIRRVRLRLYYRRGAHSFSGLSFLFCAYFGQLLTSAVFRFFPKEVPKFRSDLWAK